MAHVLEASPENIRRAAEVLQAGGLVAFPTETVYGLGATITNEKGLVRIFTAKGRPDFIPLIVHLADVSFLPMVVAEVPAVAWRLIETFWPGPLTLVLPKKQELSDLVTAGLPTVGVRLPQNEVALGLIWEVGVPLVAPSANRFGHPSPTRAEHVQEAAEAVQEIAGELSAVVLHQPVQQALRLLGPYGVLVYDAADELAVLDDHVGIIRALLPQALLAGLTGLGLEGVVEVLGQEDAEYLLAGPELHGLLDVWLRERPFVASGREEAADLLLRQVGGLAREEVGHGEEVPYGAYDGPAEPGR